MSSINTLKCLRSITDERNHLAYLRMVFKINSSKLIKADVIVAKTRDFEVRLARPLPVSN